MNLTVPQVKTLAECAAYGDVYFILTPVKGMPVISFQLFSLDAQNGLEPVCLCMGAISPDGSLLDPKTMTPMPIIDEEDDEPVSQAT